MKRILAATVLFAAFTGQAQAQRFDYETANGDYDTMPGLGDTKEPTNRVQTERAYPPDPWLDQQSWRETRPYVPGAYPITREWHQANDGRYPLDKAREQQARQFLDRYLRAQGVKPAGE